MPSGCGNGGITLALSGDMILFASKSINHISSGNLKTRGKNYEKIHPKNQII